MNKTLFAAALLGCSSLVSAGPLDWQRVQIAAEHQYGDNDFTRNSLAGHYNGRADNGFFYEAGLSFSSAKANSSDIESQEIDIAAGYVFSADRVELALSLSGNRQWADTNNGLVTTSASESETRYRGELSVPLAKNLYLELDYSNTIGEDYKSETYLIGFEGGTFDRFAWEISVDPKEESGFVAAYFPAGQHNAFISVSHTSDGVIDPITVSAGFRYNLNVD